MFKEASGTWLDASSRFEKLSEQELRTLWKANHNSWRHPRSHLALSGPSDPTKTRPDPCWPVGKTAISRFYRASVPVGWPPPGSAAPRAAARPPPAGAVCSGWSGGGSRQEQPRGQLALAGEATWAVAGCSDEGGGKVPVRLPRRSEGAHRRQTARASERRVISLARSRLGDGPRRGGRRTAPERVGDGVSSKWWPRCCGDPMSSPAHDHCRGAGQYWLTSAPPPVARLCMRGPLGARAQWGLDRVSYSSGKSCCGCCGICSASMDHFMPTADAL